MNSSGPTVDASEESGSTASSTVKALMLIALAMKSMESGDKAEGSGGLVEMKVIEH